MESNDSPKPSIENFAAMGTDWLLNRCEHIARKMWPGNGAVWINLITSTDPEFPCVQAQLSMDPHIRVNSDDLDCTQRTRQEALAVILMELHALAVERFLSTYS